MIKALSWIFLSLFSICHATPSFLATQAALREISNNPDVIIIASPVRTGSSMLSATVEHYAPSLTYKTHLLPPPKNFKGKILFIFSSPDFSAQSALAFSLRSALFGVHAFTYLELADQEWLTYLGSTEEQTLTHNLLAYDALNVAKTLSIWLHEATTPSSCQEAQILAVKYEDLWNETTIEAIKAFLKWEHFELPKKRKRGAEPSSLLPHELLFRSTYNIGSFDEPRYPAYDEARSLWEAAPSFQFLKITSHAQ